MRALPAVSFLYFGGMACGNVAPGFNAAEPLLDGGVARDDASGPQLGLLLPRHAVQPARGFLGFVFGTALLHRQGCYGLNSRQSSSNCDPCNMENRRARVHDTILRQDCRCHGVPMRGRFLSGVARRRATPYP
jgi:hypothetical protein